MANCDFLISNNIDSDCENPVTKGIEANGVIINRQDVDFAASVFDNTRKNVIKTLALKTGKKGYKISVNTNNPFNNTQTTLNVGTNRNSFVNDLAFVILDNSPDLAEKVLDGLANGEFVVVFENKFKNINKTTNAGDNVYQVMGWYQGLKAQTLENQKYSEETEGGWNVMLQESNVPKSALFLYNGTLAATITMIGTLT